MPVSKRSMHCVHLCKFTHRGVVTHLDPSNTHTCEQHKSDSPLLSRIPKEFGEMWILRNCVADAHSIELLRNSDLHIDRTVRKVCVTFFLHHNSFAKRVQAPTGHFGGGGN